jgi:hypothetical protein
MRKLKIIEHISLDGVIQHSADDGAFPGGSSRMGSGKSNRLHGKSFRCDHHGGVRSMGLEASHSSAPLVGIVMGSQSDWTTMQRAAEMLTVLAVPHGCAVAGVPVGTLAIGDAGARNAAPLGARFPAVRDEALRDRLDAFRRAKAERLDSSVLS